MGALVAILQNDPNLLRCQVSRLDEQVALVATERLPDAYGFGFYRGADVLLGKRPSGAPGAFTLAQLAGNVDSEALLAHARYATVGTQKDENTHPFRFRHWLFAHDGTIEEFRSMRSRLQESLPEFLRRNIEGDTDSEHAFMLFLKHLRETGHLDDLEVDARLVGRALSRTVLDIETWSREAGATKQSTLNFVATNGRVMVATRRGRPLFYALLEGIMPCQREGLDQSTAENDPRVRPHRRVKAVCLATLLRHPNGFLEVPDGSVISISRTLQVNVAPLTGG